MSAVHPLIDVAELRDELAEGGAPVLLDARWYLTDKQRGASEYADGHLPGARFVDVGGVFAGSRRLGGAAGRHPLPDPADLQRDLRALGLDAGSRVVVYDQGPSQGAARAWWVLRDAGLTDVRVLDGGFAAWTAAGGEATTDVPAPPDPGTIEIGEPRLLRYDANEVAAAIEDGRRVLDVRAADRFRGENETIDPVAGHIPGSESLPVAELKNADETFASPELIRAALGEVGSGDAFTCGSGITAAQALLAAESAGITGLRIYPGSWSDWISDPLRPVATGG